MFLRFALGVALVALAGCECGPGKACRADSDCGNGLCSTAGFCVYDQVIADADASTDASVDAGPDAGVDAGLQAPSASVSAERLDFGPVGCGAARRELTFDVHNDGGAVLTFFASVSNSLFEVAGGVTTVMPGERAVVMVDAHIPATSSADIAQSGTLTLTTNDPARPSLSLGLSMRSSGITLGLQPSLVSFGVVPLNSDAPLVPLVITNDGNVEATITIAAPLDNQFTLQGATGQITIAPGEAWRSGAAGFKPKKTSPSATVAAITSAQPVCGASMLAIPLTGQGTSGVVALSTTDVFFGANGRVDCGKRSADQTFTLFNGGTQPFTFSTVLDHGSNSPFTVTPVAGSVAANSNVVITISSAPIPARAETTLEAFGDVLTVVTSAANDPSHAIVLHQSANGAVLKFDRTSLDFGSIPIRTTVTAPFSIVNTGSMAANVTLTVPNQVFGLTPKVAPVGPGSMPFEASFSPGTSTTAQTGTLTLAVNASDVLCAPVPSGVNLSGTGTTGVVSFTPVSLDFGAVDCGTATNPRTITFSNPGSAPYLITAALAKAEASAYTVSIAPPSGLVVGGGAAVITVTPKPVPPTSATTINLYGDTLSVTTDIPGDLRHDIPLRETARGAIFTLASQALSFGSVAVGANSTLQFSLSNLGNAPGTVEFSLGLPSIFSIGAAYALPAGASTNAKSTFAPASVMPYSDTANVSVSAGTTLCQPLPVTKVTLDGAGANLNVVAPSATDLNFGLVPCGTTAAPKTFTLTNESIETLTLTYSFSASSPAYDVSGPVSVDPGATATVTVTPDPMPAQADVRADGFADTLTIASVGTNVNELHTVAVHQTAQGAILSFAPSSLALQAAFPSSQTKDITLVNDGNLAADYALSLTPADDTLVLMSPPSTVGPASSNSGSVTFTPIDDGDLGKHTTQLSVVTTATLCAPLPAPVAISGN